MTDDKPAGAYDDEEADALRCPEFARTASGWERCHRDVHADGRHHVRDRSWSTSGNTPQLQLGQSCTRACRWPDLVMKYRGQLSRRN